MQKTVTVCNQVLDQRDPSSINLNFTWVSIAHTIEEMKKRGPVVFNFLPLLYYSCQREKRSNHPNVCGKWRCGRELRLIQKVMAFIIGNRHLNRKVNVSRILMTNMNQNWSFPFHTKLCCLSFRCEHKMLPGLSIWSEYFYEPLTESRASKL